MFDYIVPYNRVFVKGFGEKIGTTRSFFVCRWKSIPFGVGINIRGYPGFCSDGENMRCALDAGILVRPLSYSCNDA